MTIDKLKDFLADSSQVDLWWVAVNNRILDFKYSLEEIIEKFSHQKVAVLHSSNDGHAKPVWIPLEWEGDTKVADEGEEAYLNGITPGLKRQFSRLESEFGDMKEDMSQIMNFLGDLRGMIQDRQLIKAKLKDIEQRERFLEDSEAKLMKKIHAIEEKEAMVNQMLEDKDSKGKGQTKEKLVKFG